jgi:hypothetical protein
LPATAVKGWALNKFENKEGQKTLLDNMIFNGKILYLLDAMLPETDDSLIIAYKNSQLEWCKTNEAFIWAHLLENKLLYSTDHTSAEQVHERGPFYSGASAGNHRPALANSPAG